VFRFHLNRIKITEKKTLRSLLFKPPQHEPHDRERENLMGQSRQAARLVHALAHSVSFTFLSPFFFPKAGV